MMLHLFILIYLEIKALLNIPEIFKNSIEFYVVLLILGSVLMFFIFNWIFKKFILVNKTRRIVTWVATLISVFFIYCGLVYLWLISISYHPTYTFDKEKWLTNKEKRYELSKDIIESKMLLGKTKAEVRQILGDEGNTNQNDYWSYYLGFKPGLASIDPDVLDLKFRDGKVIEVGQHET